LTKDAILADLGGAEQLSTLERLLAEHAALAAAVVQDSYARWLKGEQVPLTEVATVQNAYMRAAMALGLQRRSKDITQNIDSYLKETSGVGTPNEIAGRPSSASPEEE
jgi:hypothetical protein